MSQTTTLPQPTQSVGAQSDLLSLLLADQQDLSAVERFAQFEQNGIACHASQFESLLPITPLEAGEQYAFQVDLDRCSGCKACVTACHNLNGLDDQEAWRDVGLLFSTASDRPGLQHVTSACHHCVNPACMNACPTNAYEKDPITGIVKHLDDQCFGCQYCTLACPYGVPKYNADKGIVRKCDMCSQRLSNNEAPACAQACPHDAISITKVRQEEAEKKAGAGEFLPGTHRPGYTVPTTVFKSSQLDNHSLQRGDDDTPEPEHMHLPLVLMLVLIQVSVGAFLIAPFATAAAGLSDMLPWIAAAAFGISQAALAASTAHLGRPMYAFRGILGFAHSWMSREIVAFGAYTSAAGSYVASLWIPPEWLPFSEPTMTMLQTGLQAGTVLTGLAGILCSVKIYSCTERTFWNFADTASKFLLTAVSGGAAFVLAACTALSLLGPWKTASLSQVLPTLSLILAISLLAKLAIELRILHSNDTSQRRSAQLLNGPLNSLFSSRLTCSAVALLFCVCLLVGPNLNNEFSIAIIATCCLIATLLGEFAERALFFGAVIPLKMPGGVL